MQEKISSSFLDVLKALEYKTQRDISCGDVAEVISVRGDDAYGYKVNCKILATGQVLEAFVRWRLHLAPGDYVLVQFCDHAFRSNLSLIQKGESEQINNENKPKLHDKSFGIVTALVWTDRACDANGDAKVE